jgi:hypothetical protein
MLLSYLPGKKRHYCLVTSFNFVLVLYILESYGYMLCLIVAILQSYRENEMSINILYIYMKNSILRLKISINIFYPWVSSQICLN